MAGNLSIEAEGAPEFVAAMPGIGKEMRDSVKDIIDDAGKKAAAWMQWMAPRDKGDLAAAVRYEPPIFHPGGLGGGGQWESRVYVGEEEEDVARWVYQGTGIFKQVSTAPGGGYIYPVTGNVMGFEKDGQIVWTRYIKGQRPQREWVDGAMEVADFIVLEGIDHMMIESDGVGNFHVIG